MKDYCFYHPDVMGVDLCDRCDRAICEEDRREISRIKDSNTSSGINKTYCVICYLDGKRNLLSNKMVESKQLIFFISTFFILIPIFFVTYSIINANGKDTSDILFSTTQSLFFLIIPIYLIFREISVIKKAKKKSRKHQEAKIIFFDSLCIDEKKK